MDTLTAIDRISRRLAAAHRVLFITGAGISAACAGAAITGARGGAIGAGAAAIGAMGAGFVASARGAVDAAGWRREK